MALGVLGGGVVRGGEGFLERVLAVGVARVGRGGELEVVEVA